MSNTNKEIELPDLEKQQFDAGAEEVKGHHSRTPSSPAQCRVCQEEKDEVLIDLGCHCRGGLAKAHRSCIEAWFRTKGSSNICEICEGVATNVSAAPEPPQPNGPVMPFCVFFLVLTNVFLGIIACLLLYVVISDVLGFSPLLDLILYSVYAVLVLGIGFRLLLAFLCEWIALQRVHTAVQNVPAA